MMLPTASQNDAETATDNVVERIRMIEKETSDMNINIYSDTDESEDQGEHPGLEDCPNTSIIIFTVRNGFERFQNFNLLSNRKQHACLGIY